MAGFHWELSGETHNYGSYRGREGEFTSMMAGLGKEVGMAWISQALPQLVDKAKELCPYDDERSDSRGPHLRDTIYYRINHTMGYGEYGTDLPGKDGRCYAIYVEVGSKDGTRPGAHYLVGALQSLKGRL